MKYSISKKNIIKALKTESLKAGAFFHSAKEKDTGACKVCAVGAVLRAIKTKTFSSDQASIVAEPSKYHFYGEPQSFLSFLSCEFEENFDKMNITELRRYLIDLTNLLCPEVLEIEV